MNTQSTAYDSFTLTDSFNLRKGTIKTYIEDAFQRRMEFDGEDAANFKWDIVLVAYTVAITKKARRSSAKGSRGRKKK